MPDWNTFRATLSYLELHLCQSHGKKFFFKKPGLHVHAKRELFCTKFSWNWLYISSMHFRQFIIIRMCPVIWTNLNSLYPRMLFGKFGLNWLSDSGEEEFLIPSIVFLLFLVQQFLIWSAFKTCIWYSFQKCLEFLVLQWLHLVYSCIELSPANTQ